MNTYPQVQDIPALFQPDLIGSEKILWTGRPGTRPLTRPLPGPDLWFVPMGLVILALCLVLILGVAALVSHENKLSWTALLPLTIIPGLLVGYFFAIHPFVHRYWELPNTYYAITDLRILILFTVPKRSLEAFFLNDISVSKNTANPNGSGTIAFTLIASPHIKYSKFWFVDVPDSNSVVELVDRLRSENDLDAWKKELKISSEKIDKPPTWQRLLALIFSLVMPAVIFAVWAGVQSDTLRRHQEFAKVPHTARILGYQITFPKDIPEGYDCGRIDSDYSDDLYDRGHGRQGRTRRATWDLWPPEKSPLPAGIQFMVNEFVQPSHLPEDWQAPPHWKRLQRTSLGAKEVDGVKFAVTRCTAEVFYWRDENSAHEKAAKSKVNEEQFLPRSGYKISAIEYLAHDGGKLIGLRGYGYGDQNIIIQLTESMLNTFHKFKDVSESPDIDPDITVVNPKSKQAELVDPYAELIKP